MTPKAAVARIDKIVSIGRSEGLDRATWSCKFLEASSPNPHGTGLRRRKSHFQRLKHLISIRAQIGEPADKSYIETGLGSHSEQYRSNSLAGAGPIDWGIGRHPHFGSVIGHDLSDATFLVLTMPPTGVVDAYKSTCERRQAPVTRH